MGCVCYEMCDFVLSPALLLYKHYLVKSEGPHGVCGQLHCVQQSDLDQSVGLGATCGPVLITLHLTREKKTKAVTDAEWCARVCVCVHFCKRNVEKRRGGTFKGAKKLK